MFLRRSKYCIYIITAVLTGISLFLMLISFKIDISSLNPGFHKNLFIKNEVYSHSYQMSKTSMTDFISNLKNNSPQNYQQHIDFFNLLEESVTPEIIALNLDSFREGIFQYFKGERIFLPDIYLNRQFKPEMKSAAGVYSYAETASQALTSIDKVNLSAILQYIDRSDITHRFSVFKLLYYCLNVLPGFLLLILLLLFLTGLVLSSKLLDMVKWFATMFLSCGALAFTAFLSLLAYIYLIFPDKINNSGLPVYLLNDLIIPYIRGCINPILIFLFVIGLAFLMLSVAIIYLPRFYPGIFSAKNTHNTASSQKSYSIFKSGVYVLLFILILVSIGYKIQSFENDFKTNDFYSTIAKMRGLNTSTQIIPAKDETIYSLHIKLNDEKTGVPISNIQIAATGKSSDQKKDFNETAVTDESGVAKFTMDKGTYRLVFTSENSTTEYILPPPFLYDLKSAGTTILTINLGATADTDNPKWGITEIEVLDKDNKPVSGLELEVQGIVSAPGHPDSLYSYTNSEGIALFKINEGSYKIAFTESKYPQYYVTQPPLDVTVTSSTVTRYTIRLADIKK